LLHLTATRFYAIAQVLLKLPQIKVMCHNWCARLTERGDFTE
jgi:hypothetical protein